MWIIIIKVTYSLCNIFLRLIQLFLLHFIHFLFSNVLQILRIKFLIPFSIIWNLSQTNFYCSLIKPIVWRFPLLHTSIVSYKRKIYLLNIRLHLSLSLRNKSCLWLTVRSTVFFHTHIQEMRIIFQLLIYGLLKFSHLI